MVFKVGKVINYLPKTQNAIVKLSADVAAEEILIFRDINDQEFTQKESELRIESESVKTVLSGSIVAIIVKKPVLIDSFVFKKTS